MRENDSPFPHVLPSIIITITCELQINLLTYSQLPHMTPLRHNKCAQLYPNISNRCTNHTQINDNNKTYDRPNKTSEEI